MRGMNKVILIGNLGRDVELRASSNGGSNWATFSLATARSRKTEDGWTEDTDWHKVKVFQTQAELCHRHLNSGDLVAVEGSVAYDVWTDKDGNKRKSTCIMADRITFLPNSKARPVNEPVAERAAQAK